jgi:hypothetical protein
MFNWIIVKKIRDTKLWPSVDAVEFVGQYYMLDKNGNKILSDERNMTLAKATYELIEYFQDNTCTPMLAKLIDNYGQEKYEDGSQAEAELNAGEDI